VKIKFLHLYLPVPILPGVFSTSLKEALPSFIYKNLQQAFREFGKKMKGYYTNEAIIVGYGSREPLHPVRIPETRRLCSMYS
jgi:uncharacterized FAD-dependent dehydrogenase